MALEVLETLYSAESIFMRSQSKLILLCRTGRVLGHGDTAGTVLVDSQCPPGAIQVSHGLFQQYFLRQHEVTGWNHHRVPNGLDMEGSRVAEGDVTV